MSSDMARPATVSDGRTRIDRFLSLLRISRKPLSKNQKEEVESGLATTCEVLSAARAHLAYEDQEEPWIDLLSWTDGNVTTRQLSAADATPLVDEDFASTPFYTDLPAGPAFALFSDDAPRVDRSLINPTVAEELGDGPVLAVPFPARLRPGWLFIELAEIDEDTAACATLAAAIIGSRIDQLIETDQLARAAVDERINGIVRDLHDGLLQSFTGVVLQLETAHQLIGVEPDQARALVTGLESVLMHEQRELRAYLNALRPGRQRMLGEVDLLARLDELAHRYQLQWGITVEVHKPDLDPLLLQSLGWETYRLIGEAANNAARHGGANRITVDIRHQSGMLILMIRDDGHGFDFRGDLDGPAMKSQGRGPLSLIERSAELNGSIRVNSTDEGSTVTIEIPVGWSAE